MRRLIAVLACWPVLTAQAAPPPIPPATGGADANVRSTILPGSGYPAAPTLPPLQAPRAGDVTLNFPGADVRDVSAAVLGGVLGLPYTVAPGASGTVTLVSPRGVARADVLPLFEEALRAAGFALVVRGGISTVTTVADARSAPADPNAEVGYATETIQLQFVSGTELRRLLEPILPGVIAEVDPAGNRLVIAGTAGQRRSAKELVRQFDVDWLRGVSFGLFVPRNTDARLIAPELEKLLNAPGTPTAGLVRLIAMESLNGIIAISAQPAYLDDVRRFVEILDREGQSSQPRLFVYRVQNGRSADLARVLIASLGGGESSRSTGVGANTNGPAIGNDPTGADAPQDAQAGFAPANRAPAAAGTRGAVQVGEGPSASITADEANNAVVVYGTPRDYAVIFDALRQLDVTPLQVLVEAAITEVSLNDDLRYGVQFLFQAGDATTSLSEGLLSATPTRIFPGFNFLNTNGTSITATLNALSAVTNINVLSSPKLLVLNNQTASLQVGDQVPVATQSAVSVTQIDAPIVNSIEYRDTGVILRITPRVNSGGLVLLDISQQVSDVAENNSSGIDSPIIQERRIATSVAVQDGRTVALGGLIRDRVSRGRGGVPLLSDIPVLGTLFGNRVYAKDRTELLVLLTPRVIRTPSDNEAATAELRAKIRTVQPIRRLLP